MPKGPYIVFGGEVTDLKTMELRDPSNAHIVGVFNDLDAATKAWRGEAQRTVDQAMVRYFIGSPV